MNTQVTDGIITICREDDLWRVMHNGQHVAWLPTLAHAGHKVTWLGGCEYVCFDHDKEAVK